MGFAGKENIKARDTMEYNKKIRSGPYLSDYCGATDSPRPASRSPERPCLGMRSLMLPGGPGSPELLRCR